MRNDERMKLINDMITGIRTIKAYAWENHYSQKVRDARAVQASRVLCLNIVGGLGFSLFQNVGMIGILCIFLPQWFLGQELNMGDSFTLLAIIYYLFFSVNSLAFYAMTTVNQASAVINRISEVFSMEEHLSSREDQIRPNEPAIEIRQGEYAWGFRVAENQEKMRKANRAKLEVTAVEESVLRNINVRLMPSDLLVVVGKIGAGKTSLLYSILDETVKKGGTEQCVRGRVAYVEQEPFIFSGSIMDNICFGLEYTETRFRKAVSAAQLDGDLE